MNPVVFLQKSFRHISRIIHNDNSLTIITGADAPFYESLMNNLLASVLKFESSSMVYVWDLGLTNVQRLELLEWFSTNNVKGGLIDYPIDRLPTHFSMSHYNYAFKSYCIYNTMIKRETRFYLWLDAGCGLREHLYPERNLLQMYGFYSPYSSTSVKQLTYPTVLESFGNDITKYGNFRMLSGGG